MSQVIHYDEKYFEWQRRVGEFTGAANQIKFKQFASSELNTLDFGCGGGFMLRGLPAKSRMGVEINPSARKQAEANGITVFPTADSVPNGWADLLISDNALEHTYEPLNELRRLLTKLKEGGTAVFVLPCEHLDFSYDPQDINQHLYSWSPQSAGNLFKVAGFEVVSSEAFFHKHIPYAHRIRPMVGGKIFNLLCRLNGFFNRRQWNEIRVVARRPVTDKS
jgi:SAM-dependent methyltransferase